MRHKVILGLAFGAILIGIISYLPDAIEATWSYLTFLFGR